MEKEKLQERILGLLSASQEGLSVPQLRKQLRPAPSQPTLSRWLTDLRARGLVVKTGAARATRYVLAGGSHHLAEIRSQALHAAVARKLVKAPGYKRKALTRLEKLKQMQPAARAYHQRWEQLLHGDQAELLRVMTSPGETESALRAASPFTTLLSDKERERIFRQFATGGRKSIASRRLG